MILIALRVPFFILPFLRNDSWFSLINGSFLCVRRLVLTIIVRAHTLVLFWFYVFFALFCVAMALNEKAMSFSSVWTIRSFMFKSLSFSCSSFLLFFTLLSSHRFRCIARKVRKTIECQQLLYFPFFLHLLLPFSAFSFWQKEIFLFFITHSVLTP